jgi:hypothetical protein
MPANLPSVGRRQNKTDTTSGVAPGTTTNTNVAPSRSLLLDRTLALLTEHEPARPDGDSDVDPWHDVPEELEPLDEDAVEGDDFVLDRRRSLRAAITFSAAPSWPLRPDVVPSRPHDCGGDLRVTVRSTPQRSDDDPFTADLVRDELRRIGAALDQLQARTLRAASRAEAFVLLEPVSQKRLADASGISPTVMSRRRREIIEAPWGLVPLEFFWWKRANGLDLVEARLLAELLDADPDIEARAVARRTAEAVAAPSMVAKRAEAIRKQVPVMRSLLPLLPTLNLLSRALTEVDLEHLEFVVKEAVRSESGHELDDRGRGLVRLALAGAFIDSDVAR